MEYAEAMTSFTDEYNFAAILTHNIQATRVTLLRCASCEHRCYVIIIIYRN